ncbi:ATP-binding cassette domain-containing protein [Dactylosporangium cerinum]
MTVGVDVRIHALSKHFKQFRAVDNLTFDVPPGTVTGFLGPNGSGKTTTLRMLLGLVRPTAGSALIGGRAYADLPDPRRTVGAVLETAGFHPGRRGRDHLRIVAQAARIPQRRVDEVLGEVGLADAADRRVGGYSSACGNGWPWRAPCSARAKGGPGCWCSTNPATASTPAAWPGSGT